jgi:hypothetical protein
MEQYEDDGIASAASCPQAEGLQTEYPGAVRAYRKAVIGLDADLPHQEFESAYHCVEEARAIFEQRREELLEHVYVHGCQSKPK